MWKKKCENIRKKNAFWKCEKKCEKMKQMWTNVKKTFENPVLLLQFFCCSYFATGPTSAGWKSERSSSNRSEVDCADRRSVWFTYSKTMTTRSKNIKSNAKGKENKASKLLKKRHNFTFFTFLNTFFTFQK